MLSKCIGYGFLSLMLLTSSIAHSTSSVERVLVEEKKLSMINAIQNSLVPVEWLKQHLDDPDLVVLDTSVLIDFNEEGGLVITSGREQYIESHIPNAGFGDLTSDLVDITSEYPYAIPAPGKFAAAMAALGVGDNKYVVLYASDFSAWAARVWWMLRWIGFDNAAILDGGLNAWTASGFPLSSEPVKADKTILSISLRPDLIAGRDEVFDAISDDDVMLIDAMPAEHYRGEMVMYGRAGHIPSAINIPNVFADDGRFLPDEALAELHSFDREKRVITYCGGGISASANAFAMHRLGFSDIAVYMNSLDEWAANPANPLIIKGQ